MIKKESRNSLRQKRHLRSKSKILGTKECPRLNVFRSNTNIYAQIIDDTTFSTLVSASSLELKLNKVNIETSKKVGEELAKKAKAAKISKVVFDKSGYKYHGCVKALADAAREKGLEF
jgi:large subunit ribosomal protein L18